MEKTTGNLVYTVQELAESLCLSESYMYQLIRSNEFPKIKLGRKILIPKKAIEEWLEKKAS